MATARGRALECELLASGLAAIAIALAPGCGKPAEETVSPVHVTPSDAPHQGEVPAPEALGVRVVRQYPHDKDAFTQGLIWHDGVMYESTGQYGKSSLRRVRLEDGKVLAERELESELFGEGLARVGEHLIQLTWRSGLALISDLATLEQRSTVRYRGEGWGLCFDGTALVMSDGSSVLEFRDPLSMDVLREVRVVREGRPVPRLNELECVGSEIYANVWQSDEILRIDSKTGRVTAIVDASALLTRFESLRADVLNGIAYRPDSKTFLLTGKLWPQLFEVELVPR
ncbi:MAG: glutaminyl-peptide cyclotransferase [Deltaproteobacteria bacterium]|nr:glutaminyl-peptide cyclotransferase [Deltaproteobacteria bacterium]